MNLAQEIAKLLLDIKAVHINTQTPFHLTSGMLSPIYCDNRIIASYPEQRQKIIRAFLTLIELRNENIDLIAGVATAGIPHAAWIADRTNKPMVYVRNKKKQHGRENQIEGRIKDSPNTLVIEDLITTGNSALDAVQVLHDANCNIESCLAIFTYQMPQAIERFKKENITLLTLTDLDTLLDVAVSTNILNSKDKKSVLQWRDNPKQWHAQLA